MSISSVISDSQSIALDERSRYLRRLVTRALIGGGRGHPGPAFSLIEILRVLYDDVLNIRPSQPDWANRDRLILSKGHGCLALYSLLADKGFFAIQELDDFCRFDSILGGHPERGKAPGVEASTGALGHGLSIGLGMALAARAKGAEHRIFVVMGDGEINEGSVWEAALSAGKHKVANLHALIDYNKFQSYGPTAVVQDLEPLADKWRAFGFHTIEVNGHSVAALRLAFAEADKVTHMPTAFICHTVKGKGVPEAENNALWHHKSNLKDHEKAILVRALGEIEANA